MKKTFLLLASLFAVFGTASAAPMDAESRALAKTIEAKTGIKPTSVTKSPVAGLFEVVANRKLIYMDKAATYVIVGNIFEMATDTNLTQKRLEELSRVDWKTLPLKDALKVVYGNGKRKAVVFTDARCTYCSLLEKNFETVSNVTVYNFIHPVLNSRDITRSILCSKDPVKAWKEHMLTGAIPSVSNLDKCDTSVLDRNLELGKRFGISGTPVIIFEDGRLVPGTPPPEELDKHLNHRFTK